MALGTVRRPPAHLLKLQASIEQRAREYGLDFFDTIFEMVDYEEMSMLAAFGGFPQRYPHWRFGAQYDELTKGYTYGLQKIYEMVINTDPCYAYLLESNELTDQKLVMAHVYGHCDFFKNSAWFAPTNRRMLDEMANHAARVNRFIDRYGYETVEQFLDVCLSIEDLIDPYRSFLQTPGGDDTARRSERKAAAKDSDGETQGNAAASPSRFPSKPYMESFINPPEVLEREAESRQRKAREREETRSFPTSPERDVLLFLIQNAPLKSWQRDLLSIVREEACYFAPQGQTKIMNEGWASYWHSTIMTTHALTDAEAICYAEHHSGTMATSANRLNPYKLGIELFRDIEERWDRGCFGPEYDSCDDVRERQHWDRKLGLGREKIFEVRRIHNDVTFIDTFLTPEFCARHKMFSFAYNDSSEHYEIASRQFEEIKKQLLTSLTNHGRPVIEVVDGNYLNRGELYLRHRYQGTELRDDYARATLANLEQIWSRPVHLETMVDDEVTVLNRNSDSLLPK